MCVVPALARALLDELDVFSPSEEQDTAKLLPDLRLCYCGGASLPHETLERIIAHGFPIVEGYGATECTGLISANSLKNRKLGTVGLVYPACQVRIAQDGEIQVSGENVMCGYWNDPKATQTVFTADGWFCTGDIGTLSNDGYVIIRGRKKSLLLLVNGKNIFPEELEAQLERLPAVTEAFVYEEENKLCAMIYSMDESLARESIDQWNRCQPDWRRPGKLVFCHEPFPRSSIGKKKRGTDICQKS